MLGLDYGVPFVSKFRIEDYMQIGGYIEQMKWVFTKYPCTSRRFTKSPTVYKSAN